MMNNAVMGRWDLYDVIRLPRHCNVKLKSVSEPTLTNIVYHCANKTVNLGEEFSLALHIKIKGSKV